MIKCLLDKAIQEGLIAGTEISAKMTPEIWKKIMNEKEKPPTLAQRLKMIDAPYYPCIIHLD